MTADGPAGPPTSHPIAPDAVRDTVPDTVTGSVPPGVPAPPPGPGVQPPFAAPPTEGRTVRLWIGLGVAALAVLICCGGGTVALIGLAISGVQAVNEQARVVVEDYFEAVGAQEYDQAYALLCEEAKKRETSDEFERRVAAEPEINSYEVGEPAIGVELTVPVEVSYVGGDRDNLSATLDQDAQTAELRICRID